MPVEERVGGSGVWGGKEGGREGGKEGREGERKGRNGVTWSHDV